MKALFAALAFVAGVLLAVQVGSNTRLSKGAGGPFAATTLHLGMGAPALTLLAVLIGTLGAIRLLPEVTWWLAMAAWPAPSTWPRPLCSSPGSAR
jgi:transporter family-2 protein